MHVQKYKQHIRFFQGFKPLINCVSLTVQSNFAPVVELGEAIVVTSIQGQIPDDFPEGVYIRNGGIPFNFVLTQHHF